MNSYKRQTMHRGKVDPGVSELPRGNELSRDHVNKPYIVVGTNEHKLKSALGKLQTALCVINKG